MFNTELRKQNKVEEVDEICSSLLPKNELKQCWMRII